jgi:hypothetical protein
LMEVFTGFLGACLSDLVNTNRLKHKKPALSGFVLIVN